MKRSFHLQFQILLLVVVLACGAGEGLAAAKTATAAGGGTWATATWSPVGVPVAGDTCTINSGINLNVDTAATCGSLTVGNATSTATTLTLVAGGSLNITTSGGQTGNISINPSNVNRAFTIAAATQTLTVAGTVTCTANNTQTISVSTGQLLFTNAAGLTWANCVLAVTNNNAGGSANFTGLLTQNSGTIQNTGTAGTINLNAGFTKTGGTFTTLAAETINFGGSLTVSNAALTFNATSTQNFTNTATLTPTAAITFGNLTINPGGGNTVTQAGNISVASALTVSTGTLNNSTFTTGVAGNFVVNGIVSGTGAITLSGNGTNIDGTGSVTNTTAVAITNGNKTVLSTANLSFAGTLAINGNRIITNNGIVTITATPDSITGSANGSTWVNAANSSFTVSGTLLTVGGNPGTLTASANPNTVNYAGAAQTVKLPSGAPATYYNLTLSGSGTKTMPATVMTVSNNYLLTGTASSTLAANLTVGNNLTVSSNPGTLDLATFTANRSAAGGTINVQDNATLKIGGTSTFPTNYSTRTLTSASTVEYNGGAQAVTAETYGHLTLTGSATTKLMATGTTTIAGNLTINTNVTYNGTSNNPVVNLAGNFSNSGTFNSGTGQFTLNGAATAAQSVSGTPSFSSLRINNTGSPGGVSLSSNITVSTLLTLNSGVVTTSTNTLITSANCPGSISRTGTGHVAGFLRLQVPAGTSTCVQHVGDSTTYRPVSLTFPSTTTAGTLTGSVSQSAGEHGNIATSQIDAAQNVNRFWTLTNGGVGLGGGSYDATFTFIAGDVDTNAAPLTFEVQRWTGASWAAAETVGTNTATTTQATGLTGFSDFAVGQRRLSSFEITVPGSPVDTCTAQPIVIKARDSSNKTLTNYRALVNLSTSSNHGTWTVGAGPANGTLTDTTPDDGAATYQFVPGDSGSITLRLTNNHADNLTVSVNDSTAGVTSNSVNFQYTGNSFVITNDTIQVAGRNQTMTVAMNGSASCSNPLAGYTGAKNLKAWLTLDASDPGGTVPAIVSPALTLPTTVPGANNLTLTFASGSVSFSLSTTDVGKYVLNLRDDSGTFAGTVGTPIQINGSSPTITTRPFALVASDIKQVASPNTPNPAGTATSGNKFIAAADTFQATVGGYRYNQAVDANNDGLPDAGATFAQVTANGRTPSYKWPTTLSASASSFTPATGSVGTLSNGSLLAGDFATGQATRSTLTYSEVGSFTLAVAASDFLNSGFDLHDPLANRVRVYLSTGTESAVVGRFFPDHFTLTASSITPACAGGSFTYMGQPNLGYTFGLEAQNKSNNKTNNYTDSIYNVGTVSVLAENNNNGTDLSSRLPSLPVTGWSSGTYSFSTTTATFSRVDSPVANRGPFDLLRIGVKVNDADGPVIASQDMNPATSTDCVAAANCTGKALAAGVTTKVRFGRLAIGNANGSSALPLPVRVEAQYWNGNAFITNTMDACTVIAASVASSNINMTNYGAPLTDTPKCLTALSGGGVLASGRLTLQLAAPKVAGSVDLTVNLGAVASGNNTCLSAGSSPTAETPANRAFLQSGTGFTQNPSARATFGIFKGSEEVIFMRENF